MNLENQNWIDMRTHKVSDKDFAITWKSKKPSMVILTIPHDVTPKYEWPDKFREYGVTGGDPRIWPMAKDIMFGSELPIREYVSAVRGQMSRGMIDYNRGWPEGVNYYPLTNEKAQTALDNPNYAFAYQHYHDWVEHLIEESIKCYGNERCLLIDLHGFAKQPDYAPEGGYDLILGTGNRISIPHGDVNQQLGEYLVQLGYKVFVPQDLALKDSIEEDRYSTDFTTRHYSEKFNINTIQIEIARWFKNLVQGKKIGSQLAMDITWFLNEHFLLKKV